MYALEVRVANQRHIWLRCAICETEAPLERVRRGQPDMTRWRILPFPERCRPPAQNGGACR